MKALVSFFAVLISILTNPFLLTRRNQERSLLQSTMMLVLVPCRALIWRKLLLSLLSHLLWITDLSHPLLVHQLLYHLSHSLTLPSLRPNALLPWTSTVPPPLLFYPLILARCILLLFPTIPTSSFAWLDTPSTTSFPIYTTLDNLCVIDFGFAPYPSKAQ
ncbi:hypothetical protein KP509_26G068800 [Ceratopteris richardii]|uniref:Uncharacterized protein n=1 Tax=Ceratopteris richardii TaxID=49495 RepID=A0A8T2RPB0_CERRI|nr:hypothetical protein KP509_26G068800 [Ceratopteris richardii]